MKPIVLSMECSRKSAVVPPGRRGLPLVIAGALLFAGACEAQLYKWVDENGKVQYSDSVPPSANDRARKELRADGTLKRETERAATAEEKRIAALRAAEEAKAREAKLEQERKDKALLSTYADLKDFDRVRDRAIGNLEAEIRNLTEREAVLGKIVAGQTVSPQELAKLASPAQTQAAPAGTPAPGAPAAGAGAPKAAPPAPAKPAAPKSASAQLLEAKSELPRVTELLTRKRRDRADLATLYAAERIRLANLIDAENAKLAAATAASPAGRPAGAATPAPAPARK